MRWTGLRLVQAPQAPRRALRAWTGRRPILLLLVPIGLLAQAPPPPKLLTFDIAAIDKRGDLVSDLTAEEFRVADAGRRQQIVYFRRGQDVTPRASVLTREYSNRGYGTFPHATAVLLDLLNTRTEMAGTEWDHVARSLQRAEADPYTYFYLLQKNGALFPVHALPESWVESAPEQGHWTREILPLFEDMRREYNYRARPEEMDVSRLGPGSPEFDKAMQNLQKSTQTALEELSVLLAPVPGPKSIVWVGPNVKGRPAPPVNDPTGAIRDVGGKRHDPIPIYYVSPASSHAIRDDGTPSENGDVEKTIAKALADAQRGYRIGYRPPPANWDGQYHDVHITCTRPGVTVRAVAGYRAVRGVDIADDQRQVVPDMESAAPFDAATIRFRLAALPDSTIPRFDLRVDANDVLFRRAGNRYLCALSAIAIRYTEAGEVQMPEEVVPVDLNLSAEAYAAALRDGIPIRLASREVAPGTRFRLVVYDRATRSFGVLTIPARSAAR